MQNKFKIRSVTGVRSVVSPEFSGNGAGTIKWDSDPKMEVIILRELVILFCVS